MTKEVRLIDANALIEGGWVLTRHGMSNRLLSRLSLADVPTIDPDSLRPHGKWVISSDGYYPYCSECKEEPKGGNMTKFCSNCGAKMEG